MSGAFVITWEMSHLALADEGKFVGKTNSTRVENGKNFPFGIWVHSFMDEHDDHHENGRIVFYQYLDSSIEREGKVDGRCGCHCKVYNNQRLN